MFKQFISGVVCVGMFAGVLLADDDPNETLMVSNGRWWSGMTEGVRLGYLAGYIDGLIWMNGPRLGGMWPAGMKNGEILSLVDQFYKEPANARVPLPNALEWTAAKVAGMSAAKLEEKAEKWRDTAAKTSSLTTEQVIKVYDEVLSEKEQKKAKYE